MVVFFPSPPPPQCSLLPSSWSVSNFLSLRGDLRPRRICHYVPCSLPFSMFSSFWGCYLRGTRAQHHSLIMTALLLGCHLHDKCKAGEELFPFTFPYADSHAVREVTHKFPVLPQQKIWMTCAVFHPILPTAAFSFNLVTWFISHLGIRKAIKPVYSRATKRSGWRALSVRLQITLWCPTETWTPFAHYCMLPNTNKCFFPWLN